MQNLRFESKHLSEVFLSGNHAFIAVFQINIEEGLFDSFLLLLKVKLLWYDSLLLTFDYSLCSKRRGI